MTTVVETLRLTKRYRGKLALDAVDLIVDEGEVFGLLGPNGAGKTTAVKLLLGLVSPSSGEARLLGVAAGDPEARRRVGYLPELFRYPRWLTGREVLRFHARLARLDAAAWDEHVASALATADLAARADDRVATYSKGMQQRLGLAVALLGDPRLVILDEPSTALDPLGRHELRGIVRGLRERGTSVVLNSHQLSEVEQVCDRVAILDHGRLLAVGSLRDLLSPGGVRIRATGIDPERLSAFGEVAPDGPWLVIRGLGEERIPELVETVIGEGGRVYGVEMLQPSLEDRFRAIVGSP
jgi:ABC-2 type transport system ATP-binding protein